MFSSLIVLCVYLATEIIQLHKAAHSTRLEFPDFVAFSFDSFLYGLLCTCVTWHCILALVLKGATGIKALLLFCWTTACTPKRPLGGLFAWFVHVWVSLYSLELSLVSLWILLLEGSWLMNCFTSTQYSSALSVVHLLGHNWDSKKPCTLGQMH